jgi:hypothetical protein
MEMLDYLAIFEKLNESGVRYVVAGGMAVNLHGVPRMTYDIDLVLEMEDDNLERFAALMRDWGFKPRVPVDVMDLADGAKRKEWIEDKNMKAFNLVNPDWAISEIDVLIALPVSHEEIFGAAETFLIRDIAVPTASIAHLIAMKDGTGRAQDEADIVNLRKTVDHEQ